VLDEYVAAETVVRTLGDENEDPSSIAMVYASAPATSDHLNVTFCPRLNRASLAGDSNEGAASGPDEGGLTVRVAVLESPPAEAVRVAERCDATLEVAALNVALDCPAGTLTLDGTDTDPSELVSATAMPPSGAGAARLTVPVAGVPPVTEVGDRESAASVGELVPACGVKLRVAENGPNTPAAFRARTLHHSCRFGSPLRWAWEAVTVGFATYGELIVELSSTRTS
jgi:hypothetical protein